MPLCLYVLVYRIKVFARYIYQFHSKHIYNYCIITSKIILLLQYQSYLGTPKKDHSKLAIKFHVLQIR